MQSIKTRLVLFVCFVCWFVRCRSYSSSQLLDAPACQSVLRSHTHTHTLSLSLSRSGCLPRFDFSFAVISLASEWSKQTPTFRHWGTRFRILSSVLHPPASGRMTQTKTRKEKNRQDAQADTTKAFCWVSLQTDDTQPCLASIKWTTPVADHRYVCVHVCVGVMDHHCCRRKEGTNERRKEAQKERRAR